MERIEKSYVRKLASDVMDDIESMDGTDAEKAEKSEEENEEIEKAKEIIIRAEAQSDIPTQQQVAEADYYDARVTAEEYNWAKERLLKKIAEVNTKAGSPEDAKDGNRIQRAAYEAENMEEILSILGGGGWLHIIQNSEKR